MKIIIGFVVVATGWTQVSFTTSPVSSAVANPAYVWMVNDGSGRTITDSSGHTNNVTSGGDLSWSAGPGLLTTGAHFPGTFETSSANHDQFNPSSVQPFTVSFWVSFDGSASDDIVIAQLSPTGNHPGWYIYRRVNDGRMAIFQIDSAGGGVNESFYPAMETNRLYWFAFTFDGSHTAAGVRMWTNGYITPNPTAVFQNNLTGDATPNTNIYLGSWAGGTDRHKGFIAGVHLYKRVLTQAELLPLYYAGPMVDTYLAASRSSATVDAADFAAQDANCTTGGGTDDTAKLNAVLLTTSQSNPLTLDLSGGCSSVTGLFVLQAGYTTIRGDGWTSGLFVRPDSNAAAISNSYGIGPFGTAPSRGGPVTLSNFRVNGNRSGGNSSIADVRGIPWIGGVDISNVNGLRLDTVWIYDAPTYAFHGANLANFSATNCRLESPSHGINTDGWHFDGPESGISITGGFLYTGDDAIALNGPEGYSGTISNVSITNPGIDARSLNGLREYGTVTGAIVNNCALTDTHGLNELQSVMFAAATVNAFNCPPPDPPPPPPVSDPSVYHSGARGSSAMRGNATMR